MRFRSATSTWFSALLWGVLSIIVVAMIIIPVELQLVAFIGGGAGIAILLWVWFGTYYEFKETYILARMGPFFERIPYERITRARMVKSMASSMALSNNMIELRHGKNYITGTTFISPADREGFLLELASRCPHINKFY